MSGAPDRIHPSFSGIRAVIFDLDGTLLRDDHIDGAVAQVSQELARRLGGFDGEKLARAHQIASTEYWAEAGEAWMTGAMAFEAFPVEVWRRALAVFDVTDHHTVAEAFENQFTLEQQAHTLYEDSLRVLETLRGRGMGLGLITNGPSELQRGKLRRVEIESHFDVVLVSGELAVQKPQPEIFRLGLERLGVQASEAVHIGDHLIADVRGAREVGVIGVWINRTGSPQRIHLDVTPDASVTSLDGLLELLDLPT